MLDFHWDDTGDLAVYVRAPDGRQICIEAMEIKHGVPTGEYHLAGHIPRRDVVMGVVVGDSNVIPGVKAGTKLAGIDAVAYVGKLCELHRTCPQIAVNDQQEKLRAHDVREGRGDRWEMPTQEDK